MTICVDRRARARKGETLIEIMASIMVLAIGLVGVLAAIPFGGFRMSQMTEADHSSAVGRNAVRTMSFYGWGDPDSWFLGRTSAYAIADPTPLINNNGGGDTIDVSKPYIIDPFGSANLTHYVQELFPSGGFDLVLGHVCPVPTKSNGEYYTPAEISAFSTVKSSLEVLRDWYERIFYQQDDLSTGYFSSEDETEFRPRIEFENAVFLDNPDRVNNLPTVPSFTGRYTWLAIVRPQSTTTSEVECSFDSVNFATFDTVVFRDRIPGDETAFTAQVSGSGYRGGTVEIDLSSCVDSGWTAVSDPASGDYARIMEQLEQTRYIMLAGYEDYPRGGAPVTHVAWYRIANYVRLTDSSRTDGGNIVRLTLIGPDTPASWANRGAAVTAVLYPGAIGVYSGSSSF